MDRIPFPGVDSSTIAWPNVAPPSRVPTVPPPPSQGQLSAVVSGVVLDARSSLGFVLQRLDSLVAAAAADAAAQRNALDIRYEVERVKAKLLTLQSLYKLGESRHALNINRQSLRDLLDAIAGRHAAVAASRSVELQVDCPADLQAVFDYTLVDAVLGDALNNALRYARTRVRLSGISDHGGALLRLEDDGPGFPQALLDQLRAAPGNFGTSAIGLSLHFATVVANLHRRGDVVGEAVLSNNPGGGACLQLRLP